MLSGACYRVRGLRLCLVGLWVGGGVVGVVVILAVED